jgi:phage baseplate assembly protein W|tara:strand:+ start:935 stop:1363 length:429 start_codon:yes stop_codon:yes gene_type:complete
MAVELGSKIVKDTQSFNDYAIGISLPIQITNTAFEQTFQTSEQVKSNIKNLLLTKKGERILQPEFGSGLQALLFEPNVDDFEGRIEDTINESLEQWLPYVTAEEIDIDASDTLRDNNRINVSVKFRIGDNADLNEVTFTTQG